jgi:hypothetical protein
VVAWVCRCGSFFSAPLGWSGGAGLKKVGGEIINLNFDKQEIYRLDWTLRSVKNILVNQVDRGLHTLQRELDEVEALILKLAAAIDDEGGD